MEVENSLTEDPENAVTVKRFITYITIIWFCLLAIVLMAGESVDEGTGAMVVMVVHQGSSPKKGAPTA